VAVCRPPGHHAEPPSASSADALRPPPSIAEQLSLAEAVCAVRGQGRGVFVSWAGGVWKSGLADRPWLRAGAGAAPGLGGLRVRGDGILCVPHERLGKATP
jgi:hypothetical protein